MASTVSTPAQHALRYRIWAYAAPLGWNFTVTEIADALGVGFGRVRSAVTAAGWDERLRGTAQPGPNRLAIGVNSEAEREAAKYRIPDED